MEESQYESNEKVSFKKIKEPQHKLRPLENAQRGA